MAAELSTKQVWDQIEKQSFAIIGYVTSNGEARTAGIVYTTKNGKINFTTGTDSWKAKHIQKNPGISMTITVPKKILFLPWIRIPDATITFSANAKLINVSELSEDIADKMFNYLDNAEELRKHSSAIEITPDGAFLTYGIGVPVKTMMNPAEASARVPVN